MPDDIGELKTYYSHEAAPVPEMGEGKPNQLTDDDGVHELHAVEAHELPADQPKKLGDAKILAAHER